MAKTTIKDLVSLILEQVITQARINEVFPPDQYVLIDDPQKYPELTGQVQDERVDGQGERPTIQMQPKPQDDKIRKLQPEPELAMVAEAREAIFPVIETLETPMRIPAEELVLGPKTPELPKIVCQDPETNELVEGVVIGNEIRQAPTGKRLLGFYNLEATDRPDRPKKKLWYVVLPDSEHDKYYRALFTDIPRNVEFGTSVAGKKNWLQQLELKLATDDTLTDDERKELEEDIRRIRVQNAKRYGIFPVVNQLFAEPEILDHLDSCLIPETWATSVRTEHTTNVTLLKKFGGGQPEIDADFISTQDFTNIDEGINNSMDLRTSLALGDAGARQRERSKHIPRQHANYIYHGGKWDSAQRVGDERSFERAGGKTPIYKLKSKNIQEGEKTVNVRSTLEIKGNIEGNDYVMSATFSSVINVRNDATGYGQNIGNLFNPIKVMDSKPLPTHDDDGNPINPETFSLDDNTKFFINEGRTSATIEEARRTGFFPSLMDKLGDKLIEDIDPDMVLQTMLELVQSQIDQEQPEI